ncbi:hypothetical protein J5226_07025 [Lysobacter sp. K5869]|uniref:hypothetical protein n=1 Tax=Lysobacter sp. K5869 TaxID=2820808 RepID=UPI001C063029|nr:hypothetical protein [Lysobacter sp. K5869]QWP78142.1 hypothetical protein J5226_07025 [Lysobacter sp. K5869]
MAVFRLPLHRIEARFGAGKFDDACDAIAGWLVEVGGDADRHRIGHTFDTAHPNPQFHTLVLIIDGVPPEVRDRLSAQLLESGLIEAGHH